MFSISKPFATSFAISPIPPPIRPLNMSSNSDSPGISDLTFSVNFFMRLRSLAVFLSISTFLSFLSFPNSSKTSFNC